MLNSFMIAVGALGVIFSIVAKTLYLFHRSRRLGEPVFAEGRSFESSHQDDGGEALSVGADSC